MKGLWSRRLALVAFVAVGASAFANFAHADTLDKLKETKYALLGSYNEPPHNWIEPSGGGYKGIDFEIGQAILTKLGVETIHEIPVDWSGLIPGLQAGRWDLLAVGMSITEERAKQINFTNPIYE